MVHCILSYCNAGETFTVLLLTGTKITFAYKYIGTQNGIYNINMETFCSL